MARLRDGVGFSHGGAARLVAKLCSLCQHPLASAKAIPGSGKVGAEGHGDVSTPLLIPWKTSRAKGEMTGVEGKGCSQSSSKGCGKVWQWEIHPRVRELPR